MSVGLSEVTKSFHGLLANDIELGQLLSVFNSEVAVFTNTVPNGAELPYIKFSLTSSLPLDTHDRRGENPIYQLSVFALSGYLAEEIFSAADNLLHSGVVSPSGYDCLMVRRSVGPKHVFEQKEQIHQVHADYKVWLQES